MAHLRLNLVRVIHSLLDQLFEDPKDRQAWLEASMDGRPRKEVMTSTRGAKKVLTRLEGLIRETGRKGND